MRLGLLSTNCCFIYWLSVGSSSNSIMTIHSSNLFWCLSVCIWVWVCLYLLKSLILSDKCFSQVLWGDQSRHREILFWCCGHPQGPRVWSSGNPYLLGEPWSCQVRLHSHNCSLMSTPSWGLLVLTNTHLYQKTCQGTQITNIIYNTHLKTNHLSRTNII